MYIYHSFVNIFLIIGIDIDPVEQCFHAHILIVNLKMKQKEIKLDRVGLVDNRPSTDYFHHFGNKLDGVGPVDNRPSTDQLHHFLKF